MTFLAYRPVGRTAGAPIAVVLYRTLVQLQLFLLHAIDEVLDMKWRRNTIGGAEIGEGIGMNNGTCVSDRDRETVHEQTQSGQFEM